jgi:hypothetical protein
VLISLSPGSAISSGSAFTLTIYGMNFTPESTAKWGSIELTTAYSSDTELTATVPASLVASIGVTSITVTTADAVSSGISFAINPPSPSTYGRSPAMNTATVTSVPSSVVTATPATSVTVTAASGVSSQDAPVANPPSPTISSLSPGYCSAGTGTFVLSVYGSNFTSNSTINWGNTPLSTFFLQSAIVRASIPASMITTAGSISVTVTTPGGTSAPVIFTITPPIPVIISISPVSTAAGGPKFTLTINGTGFTSASAAAFGTGFYQTTTYVSPTQLTVIIPANLIAVAGQTDVFIYNPHVGFSNTAFFTVNPSPPAITSLTPSLVNAGGAGFMLTITGTAFTPDATSVWGTTSLGTIYISPTQLRAAVPASLIEFPGTGNVTVTTMAGTSSPATFTINPSPPAICGLSPAMATADGSSFTLSISGQYFTSNSTAKWGSTALSTTYISQTQLTAVVPASLFASAGTTSVSVTAPAGTSVSVPVTINPAIKITTTALPAGTAGNAYAGTVNVTGGSPGYTWTVNGLPNYMAFSNTSGNTLTITGMPDSSAAVTFQVSVQDTVGAAAGPVSYTVNFAPGPNGANNGRLAGSYVCLLQGSVDTDGTRWATVTSFQADGQGNFNNGIFDTNSYDIGSASGIMTGSYSIGADNNGTASIHTILTDGAAGIQTTHWAIALSNIAQQAQHFRMIEVDDLGALPSYQQGTANCYLATTSAFAASTISGNNFVFGLDGEDNYSNMKAAVGLFSASGGKITGGNIDMAQGGNTTVQTAAFTGTYSAPDPATGRFNIALSGAGNSTGFTIYIIDASRMFILDNTSNDGEQAGHMRVQQRVAYSAASIDGSFILYLRGAEFNNRGNMPSGYYADVFQGTGDGAGNITMNQGYKNDAGVYSAGNSKGSVDALAFDPVHPGRATFQSASGTSYLYLFNNNSAFEMGVGNNGSLESGWLEPQTQSTFTNASLAGNYLLGDLSLLNIEPSSSVGVQGVTSGGVINAALTTSSRGILSWDQSTTSTTYGWDTTSPGTGTFLVANGTPGGASCAVISATKFVCVSQADPSPSVEVSEQ